MKRPLAAFGLCFFIVAMVVCQLPEGWLLPLSIAFLAAFAIVLFLIIYKKYKNGQRVGALACFPLLFAAVAIAFGYNLGYTETLVRPVAALAGTEQTALARVVDVEPGYGDDTVHAQLTVLELEKNAPAFAFTVQVKGIPEVQIGELVRIDLQFYAFSNSSIAASNRANNCFVGARATSVPVVEGESMTPLCQMRLLRNRAGENIDEKLPLRLSSVAAAMSVGDRRFVSDETVYNYRMAGLSHMLVVSGLHMTIFSGVVYTLLNALIRRKKLAVSLASIGVVLLFMAFTGFTPSVIRSGIACILVYLAGATRRKPDVFTSLALAAVVLCIVNPYSAMDVGLLLSFTATIGAVCGGRWMSGLALRFRVDDRFKRPVRALWQVCTAVFVSLTVTLGTLPVLIWAGMGVSLFTLPMNVVAVPLLTPIIICALILAIPGSLPFIGILMRPVSLLCGGLLVFLEKLTDFCGEHPEMYIALGGLFALIVVLMVYLLAYLAYKTPFRKTYVVSAVAVLGLSLALHHALDAGTVTLTVAGSGANAALVVTEGDRSAVVYRSRLSANAVRNILQSYNGNKCVLLADLRQNPQSTEYYSLLEPENVLIVREEVIGQQVLSPLENVKIYLKNQGMGSIACVEVAGYRVALTTGSVDFTSYGEVDILLAGSGTVQGSYKNLVAGSSLPEWKNENANVFYSGGTPQIVIRPGKSVKIREVLDGPFEG